MPLQTFDALRMMAGRGPWPDKPAPWGNGDADGEDNGSYDTPPGDERPTAPEPDPEGDGP